MFLRFGAKKIIAKWAGAKSAGIKKAMPKQPRPNGYAKTYPTHFYHNQNSAIVCM